MSEITIRLRVVGAEESVRQLGRVGEQLRQLGRGLPETVRQMGKLGDTATAVGGAIAAFVATFRRLSGLGVASESRGNYVTNSKCLLGDAEKARALTEAFYQLGAATRFNANEVAAFGAALLAAGVDAAQLTGDMQALLDLIAAMGVRREDMQRVLENIVQIRGTGCRAVQHGGYSRRCSEPCQGLARRSARNWGARRSQQPKPTSSLRSLAGKSSTVF
jgi:hypothetical protein